MSNLKERYETCGKCVHDGESPDTPESKCYMCERNLFDHRIDHFEEKRRNKNE